MTMAPIPPSREQVAARGQEVRTDANKGFWERRRKRAEQITQGKGSPEDALRTLLKETTGSASPEWGKAKGVVRKWYLLGAARGLSHEVAGYYRDNPARRKEIDLQAATRLESATLPKGYWDRRREVKRIKAEVIREHRDTHVKQTSEVVAQAEMTGADRAAVRQKIAETLGASRTGTISADKIGGFRTEALTQIARDRLPTIEERKRQEAQAYEQTLAKVNANSADRAIWEARAVAELKKKDPSFPDDLSKADEAQAEQIRREMVRQYRTEETRRDEDLRTKIEQGLDPAKPGDPRLKKRFQELRSRGLEINRAQALIFQEEKRLLDKQREMADSTLADLKTNKPGEYTNARNKAIARLGGTPTELQIQEQMITDAIADQQTEIKKIKDIVEGKVPNPKLKKEYDAMYAEVKNKNPYKTDVEIDQLVLDKVRTENPAAKTAQARTDDLKRIHGEAPGALEQYIDDNKTTLVPKISAKLGTPFSYTPPLTLSQIPPELRTEILDEFIVDYDANKATAEQKAAQTLAEKTNPRAAEVDTKMTDLQARGEIDGADTPENRTKAAEAILDKEKADGDLAATLISDTANEYTTSSGTTESYKDLWDRVKGTPPTPDSIRAANKAVAEASKQAIEAQTAKAQTILSGAVSGITLNPTTLDSMLNSSKYPEFEGSDPVKVTKRKAEVAKYEKAYNEALARTGGNRAEAIKQAAEAIGAQTREAEAAKQVAEKALKAAGIDTTKKTGPAASDPTVIEAFSLLDPAVQRRALEAVAGILPGWSQTRKESELTNYADDLKPGGARHGSLSAAEQGFWKTIADAIFMLAKATT